MNSSPISPKPLTGRTVFFLLVAFFGVVIGVNLVMMRFAIKTLPGTEVDSAYSASLAYEKEIAAARDQNARNWQVDAHVERERAWRRDAAGRGARQQRPADVRAEVSGPTSNVQPTSAPIRRWHWRRPGSASTAEARR